MSIAVLAPPADIFASTALTLVDPVDCTGAMGKGLALAFRLRFPKECAIFRGYAQRGEVTPGAIVHVTCAGPRSVLFFPTKRHWRDNSRVEDIAAGLAAMERLLDRDRWVTSIAIPGLGCGLGGLDWNEVGPMVMAAAERMSARGVRVEVYPPREARKTRDRR
jgi:O-acetyl-ADP-ribose deacetylase (regulator of RNase III)